jgi:hypothetical protein
MVVLQELLQALKIEKKVESLTELTKDMHLYPDFHGRNSNSLVYWHAIKHELFLLQAIGLLSQTPSCEAPSSVSNLYVSHLLSLHSCQPLLSRMTA